MMRSRLPPRGAGPTPGTSDRPRRSGRGSWGSAARGPEDGFAAFFRPQYSPFPCTVNQVWTVPPPIVTFSSIVVMLTHGAAE